MNPLFEICLRMGDSTLILGHRVSEWCGHAPVLEEDIALANTALDMIGQTQLWLGLAGGIEGKGRDADALAYRRDAAQFRNFLLVERPNGDFGQTIMRQFLFDSWHHLMLNGLKSSTHNGIAEIAAKAEREVAYHLERSADLVVRLGDGTEESHQRMQRALDLLWPWCGEMFAVDPVTETLVADGVIPNPVELREKWLDQVGSVLSESTLTKPNSDFSHKGGTQGRHTEHLGHLLAEMQFLQRAYPDAQW